MIPGRVNATLALHKLPGGAAQASILAVYILAEGLVYEASGQQAEEKILVDIVGSWPAYVHDANQPVGSDPRAGLAGQTDRQTRHAYEQMGGNGTWKIASNPYRIGGETCGRWLVSGQGRSSHLPRCIAMLHSSHRSGPRVNRTCGPRGRRVSRQARYLGDAAQIRQPHHRGPR